MRLDRWLPHSAIEPGSDEQPALQPIPALEGAI
jgi:hypothetical protein